MLNAFPFDSQVTYGGDGVPIYDRAVTSEVFRRIISNYYTNGVFALNNTAAMRVTSSSGMNVSVMSGAVMINGATGYSESNTDIQLEAAHSSYPRIDAIVARMDDNADARSIELMVITGTPATSPTAPEPVRQSAVYDLVLANVRVSAGATSISDADITDTRANTDLCGIVAAQQALDTNSIYTQVQADLAGFKANEQADFMAWFATLQDILDSDTAGHLQNEIDELKNSVGNSKELLATAITAKRVPTSASDTFAQMASNISAITLGSGNATRNQVLNGRTFTNDDGVEYSGTMPNRSGGANASNFTKSASEWFRAWAPEGYYAEGAPVWVNPAYMGNASAADVVKGKTFTSQLGLQIVGTHDIKVGQSGNYPNNMSTTRSVTTEKAYSRCIIVAVGGHGAKPTMTANGGTLTELYAVYTNNGAYGAGLAVYRGDNIPNGATITVNFGGGGAYGQAVTIIEA